MWSACYAANYLDYNALAKDPVQGQHLGILLIELGVGITVAFVMVSLFYSFAGYRQSEVEPNLDGETRESTVSKAAEEDLR